MIGKISPLRHVAVGVAVVGTTILTATGVIGGGSHPERYDQWQSVVEPAGTDGVRLTHVIDQDFGSNDRRGHETFIPNDFGVPTDVTAESPDAPDRVTVDEFVSETRIRIGEVDTFISGQHRYTLAYTLPEAKLDSGVLSLDVLGTEGEEIDTFELVVTGWVLGDPVCFVGAFGSSEECELLESEVGYYRWVVEPVDANAGVTVEGDILDSADVVAVEPPPLPERRTENQGLLTVVVLVLGVLGGAGTYLWARRRGRNEVFAGGAAEAAYGKMPPPGSAAAATASGAASTTLVTDDDMADLATIEFVPPKGLSPWQGRVLLDEHTDSGTIEAWLSGLAGMEAVEIAEDGSNMVIRTGPKRHLLGADDERLLDGILQGGEQYTTGKYNATFAAAWSAVGTWQKEQLATSNWWKHLPPGSGLGTGSGGSPFGIVMVIIFIFVWSGSILGALAGLLQSPVMALIVGLLFPAIIAYLMYRALLPARSAAGSALALRTESFRRFLHESEGHHVEWAWEHGLLREYSGWAVALGEADAWSKALERANVPPPARMSAAPIIVAHRASSVRSSYTKPSSSGSGGSGGFRGGSVGGGGGGGSRGSW